MTAVPSLFFPDCQTPRVNAHKGLIVECHEDHLVISVLDVFKREPYQLDAGDWTTLVEFVATHTTLAAPRVGPRVEPPTPPPAVTPSPTIDAPTPSVAPRRGRQSKSLDETAIIARMRELATDGKMPPRTVWDAERGELPSSKTLMNRRTWSAWATSVGLQPNRRRRIQGSKTDETVRASATVPSPVPATMPSPADASRTRPPAMKPRDGLLLAAKEVARTIAVDGKMPSQRKFDVHKPTHMPLGGELLQRLGLSSWGQFAELCELEYAP